MNKKMLIREDPTDILVVEDSRTQAAQIKYFLDSHNYKTEVMQDGNQALSWLASHKPSLIISDILMPGMNGYELCEKIKSDKRTEDIPVILLTSLSDMEEVAKGLIAGADSFITKPYNEEHLLSNIKTILYEIANPVSGEENKFVEINYQGRKELIRTSPQKVITLLFNIYQGAIYQNEKLVQTQEELRELNEHLETLVQERTSALAEEINISRQITNRLRESEEKIQSIFRAAPVGIGLLIDKIFMEVNDTFCIMTGFNRDEIIGKSSEIMYVTKDEFVRVSIDEYRKIIEKGTSSFETKIKCKDGRVLNILLNLTALHKKDINKGITFTAMDITELKHSEDALKESEAKYRRIVETANEGIWKVDADLTTIFVNDKMAEMLGYSSQEMTGLSAFDFMDKESEALARKNLESRRKGIKGSYEHRYIRKDGTPIITFANVTPLFDSEGRFGGSIGLLTDITERKQIEDALKESSEKLNLALENGNIGIWELDINSDEFLLDERMGKMLGLKQGAFIRTLREFETLVHKEDKSLVRKSIRDTLDRGVPYETIFRSKPKKGKIKYFSLKALVNKDTEGNPVRITGVCFDVTKLQEDADQIFELNKKLLISNKELESFAYVASHDLQEPLRMVSSFTQLLAKQYSDKLDDRAHEYIQFAVDGAHRMYDLINGLLAYSRIQRTEKIYTKLDLNRIIDNVIKILAIQISEKNASIKTDKLPLVLADESQINQLFQNLISNSIKFSIESPKIYISSKTERDQYIISVKDEGIGIEPQYYEKIFRIFQQLHPKNYYEGTGIGLSICKSIVERHKGKIWVESEPGKGSAFFFTIPKKNT